MKTSQEPSLSRYLGMLATFIKILFGKDLNGAYSFIDELTQYKSFEELPNDIVEVLKKAHKLAIKDKKFRDKYGSVWNK